MSLQSHARVVIIGGVSLGVNLIFHLTEEGWTDVVMIGVGVCGRVGVRLGVWVGGR